MERRGGEEKEVGGGGAVIVTVCSLVGSLNLGQQSWLYPKALATIRRPL